MKHILMTLAITAFAYCGVEAQVYCKSKTVISNAVPAQKTTVQTQQCRIVPYKVCTISADRQHVSCYKTTDPGLRPMDNDVTYYGPTGDVPGKLEPLNVETTIIKGPDKGNYCQRNESAGSTTCVYTGWHITRDPMGFYNYEEMQR